MESFVVVVRTATASDRKPRELMRPGFHFNRITVVMCLGREQEQEQKAFL